MIFMKYEKINIKMYAINSATAVVGENQISIKFRTVRSQLYRRGAERKHVLPERVACAAARVARHPLLPV